MGYNHHTDMGGTQQRFLTTQWSLIENIKSGQDKDKLLIGFLLQEYWKPVYCYLRRAGYDNEQAKDLTLRPSSMKWFSTKTWWGVRTRPKVASAHFCSMH